MAATKLTRTLLLTALLTAASVPAGVAHAAPDAAERSAFTLSVGPKNGVETPRTTLLSCDPAGGTHPRADAACASLRDAGGDFHRLSQNHAATPCPMVLKPVVATAHGNWQGKPVHFRQEFGNECVAAAKLGAVYDF